MSKPHIYTPDVVACGVHYMFRSNFWCSWLRRMLHCDL